MAAVPGGACAARLCREPLLRFAVAGGRRAAGAGRRRWPPPASCALYGIVFLGRPRSPEAAHGARGRPRLQLAAMAAAGGPVHRSAACSAVAVDDRAGHWLVLAGSGLPGSRRGPTAALAGRLRRRAQQLQRPDHAGLSILIVGVLARCHGPPLRLQAACARARLGLRLPRSRPRHAVYRLELRPAAEARLSARSRSGARETVDMPRPGRQRGPRASRGAWRPRLATGSIARPHPPARRLATRSTRCSSSPSAATSC